MTEEMVFSYTDGEILRAMCYEYRGSNTIFLTCNYEGSLSPRGKQRFNSHCPQIPEFRRVKEKSQLTGKTNSTISAESGSATRLSKYD